MIIISRIVYLVVTPICLVAHFHFFIIEVYFNQQILSGDGSEEKR